MFKTPKEAQTSKTRRESALKTAPKKGCCKVNLKSSASEAAEVNTSSGDGSQTSSCEHPSNEVEEENPTARRLIMKGSCGNQQFDL